MAAHFEGMIDANRVINLTRITDPAAAAVKHYADSLSVLDWARQQAVQFGTVIDIGTGAGFPAMPLAIMAPHCRVTAIDGTGKKIDFLHRTAAALGLSNLRAEHVHSEHWVTKQRFDLVVARALGPLDRCIRTGAKFVGRGGWVVVFKTKGINPEELKEAEQEAERAGLRECERHPYQLTLGGETMPRLLFVYRGRR